jgi:hypothetical protein
MQQVALARLYLFPLIVAAHRRAAGVEKGLKRAALIMQQTTINHPRTVQPLGEN